MSTITVVPTVDSASTPQRVQLAVTDTGTPNLFATTVTRLDPDGVQRNVRTPDGNPLVLTTSGANRVGTLYDYEAPYGAAVTYSTIESPSTVSAPVTVAESRAWLIDPGQPALSTPITIKQLEGRTRKVNRGVFYPMGRAAAVVQTDGQRKAAEYTLSLYTGTDDDRNELDAVLDGAGVLLLNIPAGNGWGIGAEYVSVGDVTEDRPFTYLGYADRIWSLPITVVDMPIGGSQSSRSYADLFAYTTYAALSAGYPSYTALLAGP
jgi:hypothetical protein